MTNREPSSIGEAVAVLADVPRRRRRQRLWQVLITLGALTVAVSLLLLVTRTGNLQKENHQILEVVAGQLQSDKDQLKTLQGQLTRLQATNSADKDVITGLQVKITQLEAQVSSEYQQLLAQGVKPAIVVGPNSVRPATTPPETTTTRPTVRTVPRTVPATTTTTTRVPHPTTTLWCVVPGLCLP